MAAHIAKEDNILYPMARNAIPAAALATLDSDCESFERQVMAPGEVAELQALANRLIGTYPGDLARLTAMSGCFSCH